MTLKTKTVGAGGSTFELSQVDVQNAPGSVPVQPGGEGSVKAPDKFEGPSKEHSPIAVDLRASYDSKFVPSEYFLSELKNELRRAGKLGERTIDVGNLWVQANGESVLEDKPSLFGWQRLFGPLQRPLSLSHRAEEYKGWLEEQGFKVFFRMSETCDFPPTGYWQMVAKVPKAWARET